MRVCYFNWQSARFLVKWVEIVIKVASWLTLEIKFSTRGYNHNCLQKNR